MKMSRILKITLNINFFKKGSFTFCGNWMGAEAGVFRICEYLRVLDPRMETVMRFVCAGVPDWRCSWLLDFCEKTQGFF